MTDNIIYDFAIYCDSLQKVVSFTSEIMNDVEMFDLTAILSYFGKTNSDIVRWFTENIDHLHIIDSIITDEEISNDPELLSISGSTIYKFNHHWFVNINTLLEYLRSIDLQFAHQILAQVMFNKVDEMEECSECSDYSERSEDYSDDPCEEDSERSGRSI